MAKSKTKSQPEKTGDSARLLAPKKAVTDFIAHVRGCKSTTSEAGQRLTQATKAAQESGVNVPAARLAERIYSKALSDAIKGRVLWEDLQHYLELMKFDEIAPPSMFKSEEVRSTKPPRKRKGEGQQAALAALVGEESDDGFAVH